MPAGQASEGTAMSQPARFRSQLFPPQGGPDGRTSSVRASADTPEAADGGVPAWRPLLRCAAAWFRSDEGPLLTPEEEAERWRLLFGCGF